MRTDDTMHDLLATLILWALISLIGIVALHPPAKQIRRWWINRPRRHDPLDKHWSTTIRDKS